MKKRIRNGIYVVVNPAQDKKEILSRLTEIKDEAVAAVQLWDNPAVQAADEELLTGITRIFKNKAPVLINNRWELLKEFDLDGIHFDIIPENLPEIEQELDRDFIKGVTLSNDLHVAVKAGRLQFDYLSFCSMFPSQTVADCEIVHPETVRKCRQLTELPIFLAGGITPGNIKTLEKLSFQGIAVVSGIMNASRPKEMFRKYEQELKPELQS